MRLLAVLLRAATVYGTGPRRCRRPGKAADLSPRSRCGGS